MAVLPSSGRRSMHLTSSSLRSRASDFAKPASAASISEYSAPKPSLPPRPVATTNIPPAPVCARARRCAATSAAAASAKPSRERGARWITPPAPAGEPSSSTRCPASVSNFANASATPCPSRVSTRVRGSGDSAGVVDVSRASTATGANRSSSRPSLATAPSAAESDGKGGADSARATWSITSCTVVCTPSRLRGSAPRPGKALPMSESSSTVISESKPRSETSVCAGLMASCGNAEMRETDAMIALAAFSAAEASGLGPRASGLDPRASRSGPRGRRSRKNDGGRRRWRLQGAGLRPRGGFSRGPRPEARGPL